MSINIDIPQNENFCGDFSLFGTKIAAIHIENSGKRMRRVQIVTNDKGNIILPKSTPKLKIDVTFEKDHKPSAKQ